MVVDIAQGMKRRFLWVGVVQLIVGVLSLAAPVVASFSIELFVGAMLFVVGVVWGWNAIKGSGEGEKTWSQVFMSVISIIAGLLFLFRPLTGVFTLSFLLAVYLIMDGVVKIGEYFRLKEFNGSFWLVFSGIVGIFLAIIILSNFWSGIAILGIMFGIDQIFSGVTLIMIARS